MSAGGRMWGQSSIVTEEQGTTQVPASLTDSSEGPVSREALYEMVWSEPMLRVAARFGVSSSYMARVCTLLNVPRPERGYWAKLAVGKAPKQPPLPEPRPGDPLEWTRRIGGLPHDDARTHKSLEKMSAPRRLRLPTAPPWPAAAAHTLAPRPRIRTAAASRRPCGERGRG